MAKTKVVEKEKAEAFGESLNRIGLVRKAWPVFWTVKLVRRRRPFFLTVVIPWRDKSVGSGEKPL